MTEAAVNRCCLGYGERRETQIKSRLQEHLLRVSIFQIDNGGIVEINLEIFIFKDVF